MPPDTSISTAVREPGPEGAVTRPTPPATRPGDRPVTAHDVSRARFLLLQAAGGLEAQDPTIRDTEFTASRRDGVPRVEVADASLLPAGFVRTKHEPDKAALLAALKAGETIPGAALAQGEETLTVRRT